MNAIVHRIARITITTISSTKVKALVLQVDSLLNLVLRIFCLNPIFCILYSRFLSCINLK